MIKTERYSKAQEKAFTFEATPKQKKQSAGLVKPACTKYWNWLNIAQFSYASQSFLKVLNRNPGNPDQKLRPKFFGPKKFERIVTPKVETLQKGWGQKHRYKLRYCPIFELVILSPIEKKIFRKKFDREQILYILSLSCKLMMF